jgi:hypothetical protein
MSCWSKGSEVKKVPLPFSLAFEKLLATHLSQVITSVTRSTPGAQNCIWILRVMIRVSSREDEASDFVGIDFPFVL